MPRCWRAAREFQYDDLVMSLEAIFASRALTPQEEIANPVVLVDGQKIVAIGRKDEISVPASANRIQKRDLTIFMAPLDMT
jgi:imidazolonepropionase-like amidohydrolase